MTMELESMAVEMPEVEGHPNRAGFRGVLTVVDVPSQRAPSGSKGRRVVLTKQAAEAALPSLIGMALDYTPSFDGHDVRRKVGVITSAEIVGRDLEVGGYLYAKDFPEIVDEVARFGRRPEIGPRTAGVKSHAEIAAVSASRTEGARLRASLAAAVEEIRKLIEPAKRGKHQDPPVVLRAEGSGHGLGMSFEVTSAEVLDKRARVWTLTEVTFTGAAILRKDKAAFEETWIELVQ